MNPVKLLVNPFSKCLLWCDYLHTNLDYHKINIFCFYYVLWFYFVELMNVKLIKIQRKSLNSKIYIIIIIIILFSIVCCITQSLIGLWVTVLFFVYSRWYVNLCAENRPTVWFIAISIFSFMNTTDFQWRFRIVRFNWKDHVKNWSFFFI
jgi:hypothetical protein